jgi:hypothetical protein
MQFAQMVCLPSARFPSLGKPLTPGLRKGAFLHGNELLEGSLGSLLVVLFRIVFLGIVFFSIVFLVIRLIIRSFLVDLLLGLIESTLDCVVRTVDSDVYLKVIMT